MSKIPYNREDEPRPGTVLEAIAEAGGHFPLLYFVFSRGQAEQMAAEIAQEWDFLLPAEKRVVAREVRETRACYPGLFSLPGRRGLPHLLLQGVAYHHAGLAPQLKLLVEKLYCLGLIRVVFCTETFAAGINYPAAAAVFHSCRKWDGHDFRALRAREFFQMAGRAGRRGFDQQGWVYVRVSGRRPEETGFYRETAVEPVESAFTVTPATVLNMLQHGQEELWDRFLDKSLLSHRARRQKQETEREIAALRQRLEEGQLRGKKAKSARNRIRHLTRHLSHLEEQARNPRRQFQTLVKVLTELGYIGPEGLGPKGVFASRLRYQEVLVTELAFRGWLERPSPQEVAALLAGVDYEPGRFPAVRPLELPAWRKVAALRQLLLRKGVPEAFCRWHPEPCALAYHWYRGANFGQLLTMTSLQEGDIISLLRREIDLLRQLEEAAGDSPLAERARELRLRLDRDEVQAVI